jgi:hypothetical protein
MQWPDGSPILMHSNAPYDPVKAHEYYEKHKKLHPRAPGQGTFQVKSRTGHTYNVSAKQLAEQKVYAAHRVAQIKKNLSDLAVLLRDKMEKAKEAEKKAAKPPTLAEKAQAAREAKKYRDSHKQEISNKAKKADSKSSGGSSGSKKPGEKTDTVESLKADITKTKASLKDAVAKQRELATAKKNG